MNEAREHALAAGADDFITKPVNVEQLRAIVQKYTASAPLS
jgi:CheY-like chemotaxis protein